MEKIKEQAEHLLNLWKGHKKLEAEKRKAYADNMQAVAEMATCNDDIERGEVESSSLRTQYTTHERDADMTKGQLIGMIKTLNILGHEHELQGILTKMV